MNEALVERAVREMSPSAFCKMATFLEAGENSDDEGKAAALASMTDGELREVAEVVKIAFGEEF